MDHEYDQDRKHSPAANTGHHEAVEPGQSSRSALLRRPEQPIASGLVQRKAAPEAQRPSQTGLPDSLKAGIERLSGVSLDGVTVHYGSSRPAELHALAYTQGSEIHVAPGQEQHLPHEAWHVVQQMQGRVNTTRQLKGGVPLNDDRGLEHEADEMGQRAVQLVAAEPDPAHDPACRCGCNTLATLQRAPVQRTADQAAPIQRCVSCGDNTCIKGEKCGYDRTQGGLFSPAAAGAPAVLPYNSSNAKKQSGKAAGMELEHVIPGATLRRMGQGAGYGQEYVVPTSTDVHRGGVKGAGGGISSTGSSHTAKGWAADLAAQPSNFALVRTSLIDQINSHIMQRTLTEAMVLEFSDWLVAQESQHGRITRAQRADLMEMLMNRFLDQKR